MTRLVEITGEELNTLISSREIYIPTASRSIHVFNNGNEKEVVLNYEGQGYRPVKVTIEFEYDDSINFSEGDN